MKFVYPQLSLLESTPFGIWIISSTTLSVKNPCGGTNLQQKRVFCRSMPSVLNQCVETINLFRTIDFWCNPRKSRWQSEILYVKGRQCCVEKLSLDLLLLGFGFVPPTNIVFLAELTIIWRPFVGNGGTLLLLSLASIEDTSGRLEFKKEIGSHWH